MDYNSRLSLKKTFEDFRLKFEQAEKDLEECYLPLIRDSLSKNDLERAKSLVREMPELCVAKVFAMDMIRQYNLKS